MRPYLLYGLLLLSASKPFLSSAQIYSPIFKTCIGQSDSVLQERYNIPEMTGEFFDRSLSLEQLMLLNRNTPLWQGRENLQIKEYYTYSYPEWPSTPEGLLPQAQQLCFQICLLQHVQKHFQIPEMARQMGIHGTTTAEVTINEKGQFDRIEIVESIDPVVDQEVIRVLKQAPQLNPKMVEGVPVKSVVKLPVVFQLN